MSESQPETLRCRTFKSRTLRESRFIGCDLGDVVVRGSDVAGMEIDSPWLMEGGSRLLVNGVDVVPLVDAQLNSRFSGRELREAADPANLRVAWAALQQAWAATIDRAVAMPAGTIDASVDGEWSLAQTLRHLVMASDTWLGRAILEQPQRYHPAGLPHDDGDSAAYDASVFSAATPSFDAIVQGGPRGARGSPGHGAHLPRQRHLGAAHNTATEPARAAAPRDGALLPAHDPGEEWEHHRYVVRDLDTLAKRPPLSAELAHGL